MSKYPYKTVNIDTTRTLRNTLNSNFKDIESDFKEVKKDFDNAVEIVSDRAFNKVVDAAKIEWLPPVNTYSDLAKTYPNASEGKTVMTRDSGKVYRYNGTSWVEIQDIDPTVINEVDRRLAAQFKNKIQTVNTQIQSVASGSPKGAYPTLSALQTAFPNGNNNIYVVTEDGNWYFWNGTAWTSGGVYQSVGIPDDLVFKATNLMQNSDFSNGITGWSVYGNDGDWNIANGVLSVTGNGGYTLTGIHNADGYGYLGQAGHKIYMRARIRVTNPYAINLRFYASDGSNIAYLNNEINAIDNPRHNVWYNVSGIIELPPEFEGKRVQHFILAEYSNTTIASGKTVEIFRPLVVDLTQTYGSGFESSPEEFEEILSNYPNYWFNSTVDIMSVKSYVQNLNIKISELENREILRHTPYDLYDDFSKNDWVVEHTTTTATKLDKRISLTNTSSLRLTVSNSANTARAIDKRNINLLLGEKNQMMLKVWVDEPSKISEMSVYFGNEENVWGNYCRMPIRGNGEGNASQSGGLLRKGWNFVAIIPSEMIYTNNFDWNRPVRRMRFTLTPKTDDPTSVVLDSFWINGKGDPKLVITFDDAWKTVYDHAYPIMRERGIVGTTYVIGQYVDNPSNPISPWFCSLEELKELQENGWTLGNHNWQHDYYYSGNHTPKSYVEKATQNLEWMLENGIGKDARHFCYPGGEYDMGVVTQLKSKGFLSARAAKPRGAHPIEIDDHFQIISRNFHTGVTLEQAKKWVDQCIESGGTTFFQFHQIPIDDTTTNGEENPSISWSRAKFEALMDYIVDKGMTDNCLTHAEWYEWAKRNELITA